MGIPKATVLLTGTAAVLAIGLSASPASAVTAPPPWHIAPGGAFAAAHLGSITLNDTTSGNTITCTASHVTGHLLAGNAIPGPTLGSINTFTFTTCTGPAGLHFTVTANALPWTLNGVSYNAGAGLTHGTVTGIDITLAGTNFGCHAVLDGTAAGANNGMVDATYKNASHKLKVLPAGGNLHSWTVNSGCLGLFSNSDAFTFTGTYTVAPAQTIS